ncbi:MAG TPA: hypothetical protein VML91_12090 [Burkholderiales bacterium]|nr:hypothetical protein [Burkholderiales bacterium]
MRRALLLLTLLLLAAPLALVAAVLLALEDQPLVARPPVLGPAQVERVKRILDDNDPRRLKPGAQRTVSLAQQELDLLANYFAGRYARGGARVALRPGVATVAATAELPANPAGRFLNLRASLRDTGTPPRLEDTRIGRLPVPDWLANALLERGWAKLRENADARAVAEAVKKIGFAEGRLEVTYEWRSDLPDRVRTVLLPSAEQARLRPYQGRLAELTRGDRAAPILLVEVVGSLLQLAAERSADTDAAAENRAAIFVLAVYASGKGLAAAIPAAADWPRAAGRKVTLGGRVDFAQHFAISAALAAGAGGPFADAVGIYKEVDDSRRGSGFSFADIAADRAGARFGEAATTSAASARKLQALARGGLRESDVMVAAGDLPESMPEADFKRRFGGVDAPAYSRMIGEIDARVAALPAHR